MKRGHVSAPQNTFIDTIIRKFDSQSMSSCCCLPRERFVVFHRLGRSTLLDFQCTTDKQTDYLLQWCVLRVDRLLTFRYHPKTLHVWISLRQWNEREGRQTDSTRIARQRRERGGDYPLQKYRYANGRSRSMCIFRCLGTKFRCSVLIAPVKNELCDIILFILEFAESTDHVSQRRKRTYQFHS